MFARRSACSLERPPAQVHAERRLPRLGGHVADRQAGAVFRNQRLSQTLGQGVSIGPAQFISPAGGFFRKKILQPCGQNPNLLLRWLFQKYGLPSRWPFPVQMNFENW